LDYNPGTGEFTWKARPGSTRFNTRFAGQPAGRLGPDGYIHIGVDGGIYRGHRLAWLHYHGFLTGNLSVDHKDGDRRNNAISNLRLATPTQQLANRRRNRNVKAGGAKGCAWNNRDKRWTAHIRIGGKRTYLGYFKELADASAAYDKAARAVHREFARGSV
jgi:hypothetical protein